MYHASKSIWRASCAERFVAVPYNFAKQTVLKRFERPPNEIPYVYFLWVLTCRNAETPASFNLSVAQFGQVVSQTPTD